jgi:LacI family transcriptional regulator
VATIEDVARLAGVSPTTAKRAIREPERLAAETLSRVQQAIETLHYEPHQLASALRGGQTRTVGLLVGDILEPTFAMLTRIVGTEVRARGFSLLLADSQYDAALELQNLKLFYGNRVSGIILRPAYAPTASGASNYTYLKRLQSRGVAIVEIDYTQEDSPFSHIMLDNEGAVAQGISHLYNLGHRRIAYLGMPAAPGRPEERHTGFLKATRRFGLHLPEAYKTTLTRFDEEEAYALTRYLLALPEPPTAIFAFNGTCTLSAFRALRDSGIRIPEEISLLGFDNYRWTALSHPPLDVLEQPLEAMAHAAVKTLLAALGGVQQTVRHRFPAKLIVRGSCGPPRDR